MRVDVARKEGGQMVAKASGGQGGEWKGHGIEDVLRDAHRYAEEMRERDRADQRRAWLWFALLVFTVGTIVLFWAWISQ